MRTISAREIKRRGIRAVESVPGDGPVYIVARNDQQYVVIHEDRYHEILEEIAESGVDCTPWIAEEIATRTGSNKANAMVATNEAADESS